MTRTRMVICAYDYGAWRVGGVVIGPDGRVEVDGDRGGELSREQCEEAAFIFSTLAKTGHLPEYVYCGEEART